MTDVLDLITDVRCAVCGHPDSFVNWGDYADYDDLYWNYSMLCCDDPLPEFLIIRNEPLLGTDEDVDYEIPGQGIWEYVLEEELVEKLEAGA